MLFKFLIASWRALIKRRSYAILNILNLSIGIACFSVMLLWLQTHFNYDKMHKEEPRIFQVNSQVNDGQSSWKQAVTPAPLASSLAENVSAIPRTLRVDKSDAVVIAPAGNFKQDGILAVDTSFLSFFDFPLLKGNASKALSEPYSVVLSEHLALKYFGTTDVLDRSLKIYQYDPDGQGAEFKVTGVIADCPGDTHLSYTMLVSFSTVITSEPELESEEGWRRHEYYTYVMASSDNVAPAEISESINRAVNTLRIKDDIHYDYFVTPLSEIHFDTALRDQISPAVSRTYIMIFAAVALVILLFACLNYINMATVLVTERYKEVGIRRVLGSTKSQLITISVVESLLVSSIAMIVALSILELLAPTISAALNWNFGEVDRLKILGALFLVSSLCGLLSGVYPAILVSRYNPSQTLRGVYSKGATGMVYRKAFIGIQYGITVILVVAVGVVSWQMQLVESKDLGFDAEKLVVIAMNGSPEAMNGYPAFYNELKSRAGITNVARSNTMVGGGLDKERATAESSSGGRIQMSTNVIGVDSEYLKTYGMTLIAGRNFHLSDTVDQDGFILNETAAQTLGYANVADAIGKEYTLVNQRGRIIGIVKDFHHSSLHSSIEPVTLFKLGRYYSRISIKTISDPAVELANISQAFKMAFPATVFDYSLAEERIEGLYSSESQFKIIVSLLVIIAIVLACVGLFSVISYSVEVRAKEIGIRKFLGARMSDVTAFFAREFLVVIGVSCLVSMPLAWYGANQWLQGFSFRIDEELFIVFGAVGITFGLALLILFVNVIRSSRIDVLKALRSE